MRASAQPYLTREQEQTASVSDLVLSHGRMVEKAAKAYSRYGVAVDDLMQEGYVGLVRAAQKFRPDMGNRFSTYAQFWVKQMMRDHVISARGSVRRATTPQARSTFFRMPPARDVSLASPVSGGLDTTLQDTIEDPSAMPDEVAEMSIDGARLSASLRAAIATLNAREQAIIQCRFLREDPCTLDVLGAELGISKERVRQIEVRAVEKLRTAMGAA